MGSAYIGSVIAREGNTATIRVYQHHPDYGLDAEYFIDEWGAMAVAGWAYADMYSKKNFRLSSTNRDAPNVPFLESGQTTNLAKSFGGFDNLFDTPASAVEGITVTKVELVRSAYNDDNRRERLVAAGYPAEQELFHEVVMKICGVLDITIEADDASLLDPLEAGVEWEF